MMEADGPGAIVRFWSANPSGTVRFYFDGASEPGLEVPLADLLGGQKTGLFYDQRPNHAFAASLANGARVLDVFAHVGGFALAALAGGAVSALAVDSSDPALAADPRHPTQIYEALLNALLYAGLMLLYRRKRFDGQIFGSYLVGYALLRGFVEIFRGDYPQHYLGGYFTPAQLLSAGILTAGAILLWCLSRAKPARLAPRSDAK